MVEVIDLHCGADRKFLHSVCDVFTNMGVASWFGEATLQSLDDEKTLKKLEESRCKMVFVGLESVCPGTLALLNKGFNRIDDYKRIIRKAQSHGIFIHAGFIWGLDGQHPDSYMETYRFCEDVRMYLASNNLVEHFPGTENHAALKREGRIISDDYRDYDSAHITVQPRAGTLEDLLCGLKKFIEKFYSVKSILKRSFQAPNNSLMVLSDYLGFNLLYRSYYKQWLKNVKRGLDELIEKEKNGADLYRPEPQYLIEKYSYPHLYHNIPYMYTLFDFVWRYWDFIFKKIQRETKAPGLLFIVTSIILYAFAIITHPLLNKLTGLSAGAVSDSMPVAIIHYIALWFATLMAGFCLPAPAIRKGFRLILFTLISVPLLLFPFLLGRVHVLVPALLSCINVLFIMKGIEYHSFRGNARGFIRYYLFQALSPGLNIREFYAIDFRDTSIKKSLGLQLLGVVQILIAFALFIMLIAAMRFSKPTLSFHLPDLLPTAFWGLYLYVSLAGVSNVLTGWWKLWGFKSNPWFKKPLLASFPAEFWRRFNTEHYAWNKRHLYTPVAGLFRNRYMGWCAATALIFIISSILVIYSLSSAAINQVGVSGLSWTFHGTGVIQIMLFFGLQYVAVFGGNVIGERKKNAQTPGTNILVRKVLKIIATILFMILSSHLIFTGAGRAFTMIQP